MNLLERFLLMDDGRGRRNVLVDGDMEAATTSDWTAVNNATLSKQTGTPHGGTRVLRVAYNGTANPAAAQNTLIVGAVYRIKGWVRSGGTGIPRVMCGSAATAWQGTNSTSWQEVNIERTAAGNTYFYLYNIASGASYCEFDDFVVTQA